MLWYIFRILHRNQSYLENFIDNATFMLLQNDEVTEDVEGNETEDSYTEGSEVGTENDEEDFKDEFYYRRHHKMTHLPEKKRISHYRKKSVDLKR